MPTTRRIYFETFLNFEDDFVCTALLTDDDTVKLIADDTCGGDLDRDLPEEGDSPDGDTEMERVGSVLEALEAVSRVNRVFISIDGQKILGNQLRYF